MKISIDENNIVRALKVAQKTQALAGEPDGWQQSVMNAVSLQSPRESVREENRADYMTFFLSSFSVLVSFALIRYVGLSDLGFDMSSGSTLAAYIGIDPGQLINF